MPNVDVVVEIDVRQRRAAGALKEGRHDVPGNQEVRQKH
jgi:hypothetical protein